jgi:hypothetical protein
VVEAESRPELDAMLRFLDDPSRAPAHPEKDGSELHTSTLLIDTLDSEGDVSSVIDIPVSAEKPTEAAKPAKATALASEENEPDTSSESTDIVSPGQLESEANTGSSPIVDGGVATEILDAKVKPGSTEVTEEGEGEKDNEAGMEVTRNEK